jgi:prepilin-type N-terminal cleavage/methylation domain-containing protein
MHDVAPPGKTARKAALTAGFTLIELSIVLVIIGLIVGGVLVGRSLIRQAEIQSVITDLRTYTNAVEQFQQKYNALPGDMANATSYWGASTGVGSNCTNGWFSSSTSPTSTCNGNGDGLIGNPSTGAGGHSGEDILAWQHMANAGMITGNYTGRSSQVTGWVQLGVNAPSSRVDGAAFYLTNNFELWGPYGANYVYPWTSANVHVFALGALEGNDLPYGAVLTALEAMSIDQKIDDGNPGTGSVKSPQTGAASNQDWAPNCSTSTTPSLATYNVAQTGIICSLFFEVTF